MLLIRFFIALILCFGSVSHAAVAYVTEQHATAATASTISTSTLTPTGSDRAVIAYVGMSLYPSTDSVTGVTYGGAAMTKIAAYGPVQSYFRIYAYYIVAPSTGGGVVTATLSGAATTIYLAAAAFTGVDQSTPVGTAVTDNGSNGLATITISSSSGDMVMDGTIGFGATITKTGSGTARASQGGINGDITAGISTIAGASSVVQSWTHSDSYSWASIGFNIKQVSGTAPVITVDPSNITVASGATATFSATVTGTATITYQWQRVTSDICDATSGSFTTQPTNSGYNGRTYRLIATNAYGADTSAYATLTIGALPVVTVDPTNKRVIAKRTATFTITATDATSYQWQRGSTNVSTGTGGTSATYTTARTSAITDNGATFRCIAINAYGADTSSSATLTVRRNIVNDSKSGGFQIKNGDSK